jgi:hypothetical protein
MRWVVVTASGEVQCDAVEWRGGEKRREMRCREVAWRRGMK